MYCENCGTKNNDEAKFCKKCRTVLTEAETNNYKAEREEIKPKTNKIGKRIIEVVSSIVGILIIVVAFIIYSNSKQDAISPSVGSSSSSITLEQTLRDASDEMNKDVPKQLDEITQLTGTSVLGKELTYNYKITSTNTEFTQNDLDTGLKSIVVKGICTDAGRKKILDLGATYVYAYYDNNNKYIGKISVSLFDCK